MSKRILLVITHLLFAGFGFVLGIYALPILMAPEAPTDAQVSAAASGAQYAGEFRRDLADSDFLHWGEGTVTVGTEFVALDGKIAAGPDYKLYLSPEFVETEADFERLKPRMARVGDVKVFENFIVPVPADIDPGQFDTVVVWCEAFGEFITAARYR